MPVNQTPGARPLLDPEPLDALAPDLLVEVLDEATSTNAVVAERARSGAPEGLVVVAEHQTAGRGRLDRAWEAPARSALTFSVLLRPGVTPAEWPWIPLLVGYTVSKALRAEGYDAAVKWPNDVLIEDRKVAGILVERVETPAGPAAVVGVGLNVDLTAEELPVPTATSLGLEPDGSGGSGSAPDRTSLLTLLLRSLREAYDAWEAGGEAATGRLRSSYTSACVTLGQQVRVEQPTGEPLTGQATGIDEGGRLVVLTPGGEVAVGAGDVVHVRPIDQ